MMADHVWESHQHGNNRLRITASNVLFPRTGSTYILTDTNHYEPDLVDNDPITEEETVSVMTSLAELEHGDYVEIPAGSDESELQRMLDEMKG